MPPVPTLLDLTDRYSTPFKREQGHTLLTQMLQTHKQSTLSQDRHVLFKAIRTGVRIQQYLDTSMMEKSTWDRQECIEARDAYNECFNTWFKNKYAPKQEQQLPCRDLFEAYSKCVEVRSVSRGHAVDVETNQESVKRKGLNIEVGRREKAAGG